MEGMVDKMWAIVAAAFTALLGFAKWHYTKLDNKVDNVIEDHGKTKVELARSSTLIISLTKTVEDLQDTVTRQNDEIINLLKGSTAKRRR